MQTAHRGQGYGPLYPAGLRSKGHCIGGREAVVSVPWRATSRLLLNLSMSEMAIYRQSSQGRQLAPDFRPRGNATLRSLLVQLEPELQRVE